MNRNLHDATTMKNTEGVMDQQRHRLLLKQLEEIERAAKMAQRGADSPASTAALLMGLAGGIGGALLGSLYGPLFATTGGLAGFLAACAVTIRKTKLPHSWSTKAYRLLAAYEPVDVHAYRHLQEDARDGIDSTDVLRWVERERAAIVPPVPPKLSERDLARRQFTDRRI